MHIILGGTHGLGTEIAKQLEAQGKEVFVIGRSYTGDSNRGLAADLSLIEDIKRINNTIDALSIEAFFWVAGYGYAGDFSDQPDTLRMAQVNFANVLPIAQNIWKKLSHANNKFVVVSSTTGIKARSNEAVYAATKHAQVGFTRSLGLEAERLNLPIKVALFMPGGMQTPFWDKHRPDTFDSFLDPLKVAAEIISDVDSQKTVYYERAVERGSL